MAITGLEYLVFSSLRQGGLVPPNPRVLELGESNWYVPYYADIGAGTHSNWSSMAWAGIGYRFDWGNVLLVYKNIYYDQGSGKPLQDLNLGGGALAVTFKW